jgi:hypothetical protein
VEILAAIEEGRAGDVWRRAAERRAPWTPNNAPPRGDLAVSRLWGELEEWCHHAAHAPPLRGFTDVL